MKLGDRIHKVTENAERDVYEHVVDYLMHVYKVDDVNELTEEQIDEIETYNFDVLIPQNNPLSCGFSMVISDWRNENENKEF